METRLKGSDREVVIGPCLLTTIIGERINPTGRTRLSQALERGDLSLVEEEARAQAREGADIIDVNVGAVGVDEETILPQAVRVAAQATGLPISIDTTRREALEAALKVAPGKPLVNSVNGEERSLKRVLPLVRERGAAVIGLTMDEEGIPSDPERRLMIARKIMSWAENEGIPREDVIIDPLAMMVGTDHKAALITLQAIRLIARDLGCNMTLGVSGVSFGLPQRENVTDIFLALAISAGVTCPIVNPDKARGAILIADLLLGRDEFAMRYIGYCRQLMSKS